MRYQTSDSHKTNSMIHKSVGYIVVLHSPIILIINQYVSRKIFYIMTTTVTMKDAILIISKTSPFIPNAWRPIHI